MKRHIILACLVSLLLTMTACPRPEAERDGKFQATPINMEAINSEFDDYNSNLAQNKYGQGYLIFSSKRERKDVFNLVIKPIELAYDDKEDRLGFKDIGDVAYNSDVSKYYYTKLLDKANQHCNVLGPLTYSLGYNLINRDNTPKNRAILLYADDSAGDLQIKFVHNFNDEKNVEGPFEVKWLNSPKDDAYPIVSFDFSRLYFSSNRDGNFDIFEVNLSIVSRAPAQLLETLLSEEPREVRKVEELSTPYDDKCPYAIQSGWSEVLYFTSNRPGGQGGYDLYYSLRDASGFKKPVNMGARINTSYDEYRPIAPRDLPVNFNYHLGIFSSNRPGGKGGFDLYMAGFLKQDETKL